MRAQNVTSFPKYKYHNYDSIVIVACEQSVVASFITGFSIGYMPPWYVSLEYRST